MKKIIAFLLMFCICFTCIAAMDLVGNTVLADDAELGDDPDAGTDAGTDADPDDSGSTPLPTQTPLFYVTLDKEHFPIYDSNKKTLTVTYVVVISDRRAISSGRLNLTPVTEFKSPSGSVSVRVKLGKAKVLDGNLFGQDVPVGVEFESSQVVLSVGAVSSLNADRAFTAYQKSDKAGMSWVQVEYDVISVNNPRMEVDFTANSSLTRDGNNYSPNADDIKYVGNLEVYVCTHPSYVYVTVKEATCKAAGMQEYVCTACGMKHPKQGNKTVLPLSHTLDYSKAFNTDLYEYKAPTCTSTGKGYFRCTICDKYEYAEAPKLEHQWGGRKLVNDVWKQECSLCHAVRDADNQCNHPAEDYEIVKIETASTCTQAGLGVYRCPVCRAEETRVLPLAAHTVSTWKTTTAASCAQKGIKNGICSACNKEVVEDIPQLAHAYGDWQTTVVSTCVKNGERTRTCANCKKTEKQTIEKSGHSFGAWEVITDATCAEKGKKKRVCANCGEADDEDIEMVPHTYGAWTISKAPTCVEAGEEERVCTVCSDSEKRIVEIDSDAHKYGEWKSITAKTCTADGTKERVCEYCNYVDREVDVSVGHQFGEFEEVKKVTSRSCYVCRYTEKVETTKKGIVKTLSCLDGYVTIRGALASQAVVFEIERMSIDDELYGYYRENINFDTAYVFKLTVDGTPVELTEDVDFTIVMDPSMKDCDVMILALRDRRVVEVSESGRKALNLTMSGADVNGAEALFLRMNEQKKTSVVLPIVIVALTLAGGGAAAYFFLVRSKRDGADIFD